MFKKLLIPLVFGLGTASTAFAAPVALTDEQMDQVTAGQGNNEGLIIVEVENNDILKNVQANVSAVAQVQALTSRSAQAGNAAVRAAPQD